MSAMRRTRIGSITSVTAGLAIALLVLGSCSDSPSPTSSSSVSMAPTVSNPAVLVGGVPVRGHVAEGTGERALFRVRVLAPSGLQTVERVLLQYSQPGPNHHGGRMMGGFRGTVLCYDDGTHGDDIPGDGVYHFMDPEDDIGCHGLDAPPGEYHYSFWCEDIYGRRGNTASLTIVRK